MGIEDFSLDIQEHTDCVLIVGDSEKSAAKLSKLLAIRNYRSVHISSPLDAPKAAVQNVFDLIVVDCSASTASPEALVTVLRSDAYLRRLPFLILCQNGYGSSADADNNNVQVLSGRVEPSSFLVKVATLLRLRKFQSEQASQQAELSVQNAELRDLTNRFKRELLEARQIQEAILPKQLPQAENALFCAYYTPLEAVGGDLFDVWRISSSVIGLFIADVTGHGLPAAFIAAMTKMALNSSPKDNPALLLQMMNNQLSAIMPEGRFVTATVVFYHCDSGRLQLARAGHPSSYLWHANSNTVEEVSPKGLALGIAEGITYELYDSHLTAGDKLLLVTDGLTETANMDGKLWGTAPVGEAFGRAARSKSITDCIPDLLDQQGEFAQGRILRDDVTIVGLERLR